LIWWFCSSSSNQIVNPTFPFIVYNIYRHCFTLINFLREVEKSNHPQPSILSMIPHTAHSRTVCIFYIFCILRRVYFFFSFIFLSSTIKSCQGLMNVAKKKWKKEKSSENTNIFLRNLYLFNQSFCTEHKANKLNGIQLLPSSHSSLKIVRKFVLCIVRFVCVCHWKPVLFLLFNQKYSHSLQSRGLGYRWIKGNAVKN
jgi:hypothetical protein